MKTIHKEDFIYHNNREDGLTKINENFEELNQKIQNISLIPGPKGAPGLQGEKGEKGDRGEPGRDGVGAGDLLARNNLSDLEDIATARQNLEVYSKSEVEGKINGDVAKLLRKGDDLNNIRTPGIYFCPTNAIAQNIGNVPLFYAFFMQVYKSAGFCQEWTDYQGQNRYIRRVYNNIWSAWQKVPLNEANIPLINKQNTFTIGQKIERNGEATSIWHNRVLQFNPTGAQSNIGWGAGSGDTSIYGISVPDGSNMHLKSDNLNITGKTNFEKGLTIPNNTGWNSMINLGKEGAGISHIVADRDGIKFRNIEDTANTGFYFRNAANQNVFYISPNGVFSTLPQHSGGDALVKKSYLDEIIKKSSSLIFDSEKIDASNQIINLSFEIPISLNSEMLLSGQYSIKFLGLNNNYVYEVPRANILNLSSSPGSSERLHYYENSLKVRVFANRYYRILIFKNF